MNKTVIDAREKNCPIPLIMTRKAIKRGEGSFAVIVDNAIAKDNITRFLQDNKILFCVNNTNSNYTINIGDITEKKELISNAVDYCDCSSDKTQLKTVICIKSDKMGNGDDEFGALLLRAFINTLKEISKMPKTIIFYNSGIKLVLDDSPVISSLQKLEENGVEILICGACTEYYNSQEKIATGYISNMYDITEKLISADNIIYP
jgi:selenium metabolism protein YedF